MTMKNVFKSHPHFNTASRKLTVMQKEGEQKYVGVYISVYYVDCADECRNFIYTLTVLNKWNHRIYQFIHQYTSPVGIDTFTGYHYEGLHLSITSPQDPCGRHPVCTVQYSSHKSVQNPGMRTDTVIKVRERLWYLQSKR